MDYSKYLKLIADKKSTLGISGAIEEIPCIEASDETLRDETYDKMSHNKAVGAIWQSSAAMGIDGTSGAKRGASLLFLRKTNSMAAELFI
jgi:hypothetical protein